MARNASTSSQRVALGQHLGVDDLPGLGFEGGGNWLAWKASKVTRGVAGAGAPLCNNSDLLVLKVSSGDDDYTTTDYHSC